MPGQGIHLTVSIGLAQYKKQEDMKAFVHRVDQLMYQGKRTGETGFVPSYNFKHSSNGNHHFDPISNVETL